VGVLWHAGSAEEEAPYYGALQLGFRDLGYVDGKSILFEHRFANENPEGFKSLAAELIAISCDVILTVTLPAALAAQQVTSDIPIVFVLVPDPVRSKLVHSLANPGGNISGLTQVAVELSAKRLELLREAIPGMTRIALLVNANDQQAMQDAISENQKAARPLGLTVQPFRVRTLEDFGRACDDMVQNHMQGIVVYPDGLVNQGRGLLAQLALLHKLPLMLFSRESLLAGAFMTYGPDHEAIFYRSASYVDRLLKGRKPSDLPVERPTKFQLGINLAAAKVLNVNLPSALLARADDVID
jgi:putative ABC transport system substrate-binding protein